MKYRTLGRTGLYVSELCLGTMTFGGSTDSDAGSSIGSLEQDEVNRIVERAIEHGINFFDTADGYSNGDSERKLGQALKDLGVHRKDVVIATKVGVRTGQGPNDEGASRTRIMDGIRGSLERLQLDHIDLYQIHVDDSITPLDEILDALDDLVRRALVRHVGVSNWPAWKIATAHERQQAQRQMPFASVQAHYSLPSRDLEREIIPLAEATGIGIMVWSPLAGGLLSGKYEFGKEGEVTGEGRWAKRPFPPVDQARAKASVEVLRDIANAHGATVAQVALAWTLSRPQITSVIVGTRKLDQLNDNVGAIGLTLTTDELARLDEVSQLPSEYPGWVLEFSGVTRDPNRLPSSNPRDEKA